MPKTHIDKSIFINASADKVYKVVSDFHQWQPWSPWLITDPDTKLNINDDGKHYDWTGELSGSGEMTIASEVENKRVDYDMLFKKPYKSRAKVVFTMEPEGEGTRVHWIMNSRLPFFMFWMKKMMESFVGMDYERGLKMLQEYVEVGRVNSILTFQENQSFEGCKYVGIKTGCYIKDFSEGMSQDFGKLTTYLSENHKDKMSGNAFSIYHKWDPIKGKVAYSACVPVTEDIPDLPEGMFMGDVEKTNVYSMHHKGSYKYSGNLWSAQYGWQRVKKIRVNSKVDPMEVYLNSPMDTQEIDLETEVIFPLN